MVWIPEPHRARAREAAMEAAFKANGGREVSYTTERLIQEAVEAALDMIEHINA